MQISQLPIKIPVPFGKNAGGGYIRTIPATSQIGISNGAASWPDGFVPLNFLPVGSGGTPPFGQDFNGVLNAITVWNQWQSAGGLVQYDPTFSAAVGGYPFGALLAGAASGVVWLSTADNNITDPDTGGSGWLNIVGQTTPNEIWHIGSATGGTSSAMTTTLTPAVSGSVVNFFFAVPITTTNTQSAGVTTMDFGDGPKPVIINSTNVAAANGTMPGAINYIAQCFYDGTYVRLLNPATGTTIPDNALWHIGTTTGGTSTALTTTLTPVPATVTAGLCMRFINGMTNGTSGTLTFISGGTPYPLISNITGAALIGGEMITGDWSDVVFDGTHAVLMNPYPASAPSACKAWADFDGTTTPVTIHSSYNISSITKLGTGHFQANFATPLNSANCAFAGTTSISSGLGCYLILDSQTPAPPTVNNVTFFTANFSSGNLNCPLNCFAVFQN